MAPLSLREIQSQATADSHAWFPGLADDILYHTVCLSGEVGEVANLLKKQIRGTDKLDLDQLGDELADVLIYLVAIAGAAKIDLTYYYERKRNVNAQRFGKR